MAPGRGGPCEVCSAAQLLIPCSVGLTSRRSSLASVGCAKLPDRRATFVTFDKLRGERAIYFPIHGSEFSHTLAGGGAQKTPRQQRLSRTRAVQRATSRKLQS
jgi:hypothetical protein